MGVESLPVMMIVRGRMKLHALLVGKRRKVREKRLLSSFHNVFLYEVPLLHLPLWWWGRAARGEAELWGHWGSVTKKGRSGEHSEGL